MPTLYETRRPLPFEGRFLWHPTPDGASLADQWDYLPPVVFAKLDGFIPRDNPRVSLVVKAYPTAGAAMAALRRATVAALVTAVAENC